MKPIRIAALLLATSTALHAQQPGNWDATRKTLDASSAKFTSAQAGFKKDTYTFAVKDDDVQEGIEYATRKGGATEVGLKILGQGARTVQYKGSTVRDYTPGLQCYNEYAADKYKATVDSVLGLSFGASGTELAANWTVTDNGPETITAEINGKTSSVKVEKLDLIPKNQSVKNNYTHVTVWMDLSTAIALKQIFYAQNKDTITTTYSSIKLNQKVDTAPFEIKGKPCSK